MNKFKMAFALLAVLVILAAPAYASPHSPQSAGAAGTVSSLRQHFCFPASTLRMKQAADFSEMLYAEQQT